MHLNLQRLPAEQVRQRKRLPFQGRPDAAPLAARQVAQFSLAGPVTLTQVRPVNPGTTLPPPPTTPTPPPTTPTLPPSSSAAPPVAPSSPPAPPVAPSSPPAAPPLTPIAPVASAINPIANPQTSSVSKDAQNAGLSAVSSGHGLPVGAIVGITIAVVVLILGAFVFFIRQRAMRNRKTRRATAAWIGQPRPTDNATFTPFPPPPPPAGSNMGEASPGVSYRAQMSPVAARPPVANMPAPVPSSYNNPAPPPVPAGAAASSATVRYEFIPSLPDELSITTGEIVRMVAEYDDGWALCANARGEQGMVPLECLDRGAPAPQMTLQPERRNSRRTSSLARY